MIFRFGIINDDFKAEQLSVLDVFLTRNQSLTLGIDMNDFGEDKDILNKINEGYHRGLFEPAIQSRSNQDYSNLSRLDQMVLLYEANQKIQDHFNMRASLFITVGGAFNLTTIEAMNQVGLRIISGNENLEVTSDKILPIIGNKTSRANYTKVYNIPQTVNLSNIDNGLWTKRTAKQVIEDALVSIENHGYAVIALYPQDFVKISNGKLTQSTDMTALRKMSEFINEIRSQGIIISSFANLTGINKSQFYETRIPKPVIYDSNLVAEVVYDGFNFPTKMAFLGKNDILVLEKNDGIVKRIVNGTLKNNVLDLDVGTKGERGLLGIAIANRNELPPYVFLYYTGARKDGSDISVDEKEVSAENFLYRYELIQNRLVHPKLILSLPEKSTWAHNGGAMTMGSDKNLYLVIGDQVISDTKAQNVHNGSDPQGNGGILRFSPDGEPIEKGILGSQRPLNMYYAYGIRNSFGIAFDPVTGNLWDTENGESSGDEINLVLPGFNSGWKKIQGKAPANFNTSQLVDFNGTGSYREPELMWNFPAGPTGISFLNSNNLGIKYNSSVFVGDFHNGYLYNFNLTNDREHLALNTTSGSKILNNVEIELHVLGKGFGGIVDVKEGPDGFVYVLATHAGDANCLILAKHCVPYETPVGGTLFRIIPVEMSDMPHS